ncbi:phosphoribosyltransferase family protein [Streptomyces sp. NBC_01789]|uniref:phosphoribosyltransferase family protein n=1 Tax=unclassified Streptomyces TaxID=2593676 RepID=UPI002B1CD7AE|nr:phosphoribosyltransferase family protein [Streptomyces sp. NBC_01789]
MPPGTRFAVVDDVADTGAALERTVTELRRQQHSVVGAFVILDRQQGAAEALEHADCPLTALFRLEDLALLRRQEQAPELATSKRTGT